MGFILEVAIGVALAPVVGTILVYVLWGGCAIVYGVFAGVWKVVRTILKIPEFLLNELIALPDLLLKLFKPVKKLSK